MWKLLLRCVQLHGMCSLKVTNVQLCRKKDQLLGIKYFISVRVFDIFRLLKNLQGSEYPVHCTYFKNNFRASLVAQWLRICLLMQETRVRALVWEDPTCHGAVGPVSHSC